MKVNKVAVLKGVIRFLVSTAVGAVTHAVIKNNLSDDLEGVEKYLVPVGDLIVSSMASDTGADYVDKFIDDFTIKAEKLIDKK